MMPSSWYLWYVCAPFDLSDGGRKKEGMGPKRLGRRIWIEQLENEDGSGTASLLTLAQLFCIATSVMIIAQVENGLGKHVKQLEKQEAMRQQQDFLVMIVVYNICLCFTKLSILLQYTRIFPQKGFRLATWIVMGAVVIYATWRVLAAIFTCLPVAAFWDKRIVNKHCQNKFNVAMASTALNMATDLTIAFLPMPVLNQLQLPRRQKYALMAVFALGGLVVIISILRLPSLMTLWKSNDVSFVNPMVMIWSDIEINVGIICSCLPTLRCLFPRIFKSMSSYAQGSGNDSGRSEYGYGSKANRKCAGYAGLSEHGQGSFGGKFSNKPPVVKTREVEGGRTDTLLDFSAEEIEMRDRDREKIVVQTEVQQVESLRSGLDDERTVAGNHKELARMERELI
ncbi:hypothetical protein AC579_7320 [Pseudocercospora musae]|uniref:Rhodopsin domain-containing protein n=1 Tax=Pseudocercospora musae TaxID=113226 RepID=A0A139I8H1_9PEZI|nr:hypothetical protein AC579_7320 [Pseudocercospora musae]